MWLNSLTEPITERTPDVRFDLTIYADNPDELDDALSAVRASLSADLFTKHRRGFQIAAWPSDSTAPPLPAAAVDGAAALRADPPAPSSAPAAEPAKRHRRTNAQIAADKAAAEAAKAAGKPAPAPVQDDPLGALDDGEPADADDDDNDDPLGLGIEPEPVAPPSQLSPAEAKSKALDLLREAYTLPGGPAGIKDVQTQFGVKKFVEVSDTKGLELHAAAVKLAAKLKGGA